MCPEFSVFSNSGYVYAIFLIAIALFWEKEGGGDLSPETIVFDLYNSLALSKCDGRKQLFCKNDGGWPRGDTVLKGSVHLAPSRLLWKVS